MRQIQSKLKVEIEVWGIEVEEEWQNVDGIGEGWYRFQYSIRVNSGKKKIGKTDGSWSSQKRSSFLRTLKRGYAAKLVLERYF